MSNYMKTVEGVPYADYVWNMIYKLDEDQLDRFGPYGWGSDPVSLEVKALMFLDTMLLSKEDRIAFEKTSSTLVVEEIEAAMVRWHEMLEEGYEQKDASALYEDLRETLYDYLEGC